MFNTTNSAPLHIQIKDVLKAEVLDGKYHEKIPSERELMERFSVSRSTIRESINHLVHEQILEKIHGKGTFIKQHTAVHEWLDALHSFTETVERMGMRPSAKLLYIQDLKHHSRASLILRTEEVFTCARLREADQKPVAIERHYYTKTIGEQLKRFDLHSSTIYDLLEKELQLVLVEAEQTIRCCPISLEDAKHLNIVAGTNVMMVERVITGVQGEPLEYYSSIFHPELYELRVTTKRQSVT